MRLVSVTLKNFRCYQDPKTIRLSDLTALIGRNDIGKSTVLEALEIFFNNGVVRIDSDDCSVGAEDRQVEITCEFDELPASLVLDAQAQTSLADEYLTSANGTLLIKKVYRCTSAKPKEEIFVCAHHPTADQYCDLLELTNAALKSRLRDLSISQNGVQLNNNPSIRKAIWSQCADLCLGEVDIPVAKEDGKRIWEKLSVELPLFALFKSDRASQDSDAEVQDPMKLAVASALAEPEIRTKLDDIVSAVRDKAVELAARTHGALSKLDPTLAAQLTPEFKAEPKWSGLFSVSLHSDQGIPVNKRGSGVRRLILVSFFRAEAERRAAQGAAQNIIYAIEEPETSQHPHNQRLLLESFQDLSSEAGCQVLLTTHSPGFATYLPIDTFRFIRRGSDGQPSIEPQTDATWETMASELGVVPDNRVRALVCLEGPTDVEALQFLSHSLHRADQTIIDLSSDRRVAFLVLGGGTLAHWVNKHYLENLGRPEIHIYDGDVSQYQAAIDNVNRRTDGSWGVLTTKREIENYLHPDAIQQGLGCSVSIGDHDDVPALVAASSGWNTRTAKKKLAQYAFPKMTASQIKERDPSGEIEGWLRRIEQTII